MKKTQKIVKIHGFEPGLTKKNAKIGYKATKKGLTLLYQTYEFNMERPTGIEPASSPWEGEVLPLNNGRRTEGLFSLPLVSTTYYPD